MPATVIAERIGWQRGITILKEGVAELRPLYLPQDPYQRTDYRTRGARPVGSVGAAGRYPGWLRTRRSLSGHRRRVWLFALHCRTHDPHQGDVRSARRPPRLSHRPRRGVPHRGLRQRGAIGRIRKGEMHFTQAFLAFKGTLGMGAVILKVASPRTRDWSSAPMATSRGRFFRAVGSLRSMTSTISSPGG